MLQLRPGAQKITADGVIGRSGTGVRLFALLIDSGSTAASVSVYDGTSTGGTLYGVFTGTASETATVNFNGGLQLPSGCYLDIDANTDFVVAIFVNEPA